MGDAEQHACIGDAEQFEEIPLLVKGCADSETINFAS